MLGAWAEATEKIRIGALVTCNSYRNPQLLADMARTVDVISGRRLILGIGSGWFEKDYDEYDYEFGTAIGRLHALDAAMPIIKDRLAKLDPPPTGDLPILIGGGGEKVTLRIVAQYADIWHGFGDIETYTHKSNVLDEWCSKVGRDPSAVERSVGVSPDKIELGDAYKAAGVNEITIGINGPNYDMGAVKEWLAWRDEVNVQRGASRAYSEAPAEPTARRQPSLQRGASRAYSEAPAELRKSSLPDFDEFSILVDTVDEFIVCSLGNDDPSVDDNHPICTLG